MSWVGPPRHIPVFRQRVASSRQPHRHWFLPFLKESQEWLEETDSDEDSEEAEGAEGGGEETRMRTRTRRRRAARRGGVSAGG